MVGALIVYLVFVGGMFSVCLWHLARLHARVHVLRAQQIDLATRVAALEIERELDGDTEISQQLLHEWQHNKRLRRES